MAASSMDMDDYIFYLKHGKDEQIIEYGSDGSFLKETKSNYYVKTKNKEGDLYKNKEQMIKKIFTENHSINDATALHLAVVNNKPEIVKWLIQQEGIDINAICSYHIYTNIIHSIEQKAKNGRKYFPEIGPETWKELNVTHHISRYTALELAEKSNYNSCADILRNAKIVKRSEEGPMPQPFKIYDPAPPHSTVLEGVQRTYNQNNA